MKLISTLLLCCSLTAGYAQSKSEQKTGEVRGKVVARLSRQPIVGAVVKIVNDTLRTVSDSTGQFRIAGLKTGYNTIYAEADGFHAMVTPSFAVGASMPAVVEVEMNVMVVEVDQVVVTAPQLLATVESPVSMRRIGTEEIDMTPGANRDISKVVQSAPGVLSVSMGNRNDVLVRGGGSNENRYYLDGIEIPVLNHFAVQGGSGGHASLVNTDLLQGVNFYTGAFPAQFANGLSSQLDMRMNRGNSDKFHGKMIVGASDVGLSLDTPVSANGKTTLLGSFRRSYLQMLFTALDLPFLPTYNDYQFKLSSKFSEHDEIYLIGLGSIDKNRLNNNIRDLSPDRRYIQGYMPESDQSSYTFGVGYRHRFSAGTLRLIASHNLLDNHTYKDVVRNDKQFRLFDIHSHESDNRFRGEVELSNVGGFRITGGAGGGTGHYYNSTASNKLNVVRYEIFATASRYFFDNALSVLVGLRADGMDYSRHTQNPLQQLSPRLGLAWQMTPEWGLNASAGRYYQEPAYTTLGFSDSEQQNNLRYMAVNQYVVGMEFTPNQRSSLRVEGFLKQYSRLPVSVRDSVLISPSDFEDYSVGNVAARSVGEGRVYGAELSYRNLDIKNTVVNISYTLMFAQINRLDSELRPTSQMMASPWDSRHIVNVSAIHKLNRNWAVGFKWYMMSGLPYTPYDEQGSSLISMWDQRLRPYRDYSQYNTLRNKAYHQLDVRVDKVWYFTHWRMGFYVDIQNLYNFKSKGQDIFMPQTDDMGKNVVDPASNGRYKMQHITNDIGGTILPTLGITIEW